MNFLQPLILFGLPLVALPIIIHLINQWRYQTKQWSAMMFLLQANQMNRGFARIRRWLILAMRTLAIAGLLFAVARPLSSGFLTLTGSARTDTTIVLMDRSASMQQGTASSTKLETGAQQLQQAFDTLGSEHWVAVNAADNTAQEFDSAQALFDSAAFKQSSCQADMAAMMQSCLEYIQTNAPGPTEVWICSDLRNSDWNVESGSWSVARDGLLRVPQSIRFNLLAYPDVASNNLSIRVTKAEREVKNEEGVNLNALVLSLVVSQRGTDPVDQIIPIQVEIDGSRSELSIELQGAQTELRDVRIPLPSGKEQGWGSVSLPADENNADNRSYFVYAEEKPRLIVIVSDDEAASKPLEIAASISPKGELDSQVEVIGPEQLDSDLLQNCSLLIWQNDLPDSTVAPIVDRYIASGGQVIFFPPSNLVRGNQIADKSDFKGISWESWNANEQVAVQNWRGDQDLLSATMSGSGLPVGQLSFSGYAGLKVDNEDFLKLGSVTGGDPLLGKLPTDEGGVYFWTVPVDPSVSTMAESGIVLFVLLQRAIEQGQTALGDTTSRTASGSAEDTRDWQLVAGNDETISTEYALNSGVYSSGDALFAINRPAEEDQLERVEDAKLETLFEGLQLTRVNDSAGSLNGIIREVWRTFLILMIVAMLLEAALCIPRKRIQKPSGNPLGEKSMSGAK